MPTHAQDSRETKKQVLYKYMPGQKRESFLLVSWTPYIPPANEFRWLHYQDIAQLNDGGRWPSFP